MIRYLLKLKRFDSSETKWHYLELNLALADFMRSLTPSVQRLEMYIVEGEDEALLCSAWRMASNQNFQLKMVTSL